MNDGMAITLIAGAFAFAAGGYGYTWISYSTAAKHRAKIERDLLLYQVQAAERFATFTHLQKLEQELKHGLDGLKESVDKLVDRMLDGHR